MTGEGTRWAAAIKLGAAILPTIGSLVSLIPIILGHFLEMNISTVFIEDEWMDGQMDVYNQNCSA